MGRPKRIAFGGYVYHVVNRANGRLRIFKKAGDFGAFEQIGKSVKRGRPLGDADWRTTTAKELSLQPTLKGKGRPKKVPDTFN